MKLNEVSTRKPRDKAGIIPYHGNKCLFMISSDPTFGGPDPAVAKGGIDSGENILQAAVREGEEELGLKKSNFVNAPFKAWEGEIKGLLNSYTMHVFAVEVKDPTDFDTPHYETEQTVWMTREEFAKNGRASQRQIADAVFKLIEK
jgi:8-oxo-dGTP pyrophosphatase MutT (NUDIX family)